MISRLRHWLSLRLQLSAAPFQVAAIRRRRGLRVHLGCGNDKLPGFVNVDYRPTRATDLVMDLNVPTFSTGSIALAFSNAFFEHLYRASRLPHLRRIVDALEPDGVCCYIGVPYFRNIARFYLERGPGTAGPVFDLFNVYRYTHGDPEQAPTWWIGQIHKSLFDEEELSALLDESGFGAHVMFCYGYPGDAHELPVTMGFYATRAVRPPEDIRAACLSFLAPFADTRIRLATLEWLAAPATPR
jgi:predicted SAM-dependent methyltransferase